MIPEGIKDFKNDDPSRSSAPYRVFNIGNNQPVKLMDFIEAIENACGNKAVKNFMPMQAGDVFVTYADVDDLMKTVDLKPITPLQDAMNRFVGWYKNWI